MCDWDWPAIGAVFGVAANIIVIGLALWQGRISAKSSQTAADAAKTAERALELQQESYVLQNHQWEGSRRADLRILNMRRVFDGRHVFIHINVRNVGKSPAYWPELSGWYRGGISGGSLDHPHTLMPETEREFRAVWNPPPSHVVVDSVYWFSLVLKYEDGFGHHWLEVIYRFSDLLSEGAWGYSQEYLALDGEVKELGYSQQIDGAVEGNLEYEEANQLLIPADLLKSSGKPWVSAPWE